MGVIALGVAFGSPLAIAGVVVHVAGHAGAKALGFYLALPLQDLGLLGDETPRPDTLASAPRLATGMAVSLGALAGLPPSPLFVSELLILAGGIQAGFTGFVVVAAALLSLAFLGLAHVLIDRVVGAFA
jgi:hydrogenase-4 component F